MVNEAGWDRMARVALGIVLLVVGLGVLDGTAGIVVAVISAVPLLTGITGVCPLYALLRFRTNRERTSTPVG
jgi:hypothetical protein